MKIGFFPPSETYNLLFLTQILIQSVCETMVPKLVAEDIPLLFSLLSDVFPGVQYHRGEMTALREELKKVCQEMYLTYGDGEEVGGMWVEKVSQSYIYIVCTCTHTHILSHNHTLFYPMLGVLVQIQKNFTIVIITV